MITHKGTASKQRGYAVEMGLARLPSSTDGWLTPKELLLALGQFDLDPCAYPGWPTAKHHVYPPANGLNIPWHGRVWLNPPFRTKKPWLEKFNQHGNGVALVAARCDAAWWHDLVLKPARAIFFLRGRIGFINPATFSPGAGKLISGVALYTTSVKDAKLLSTINLKGTVWLK